MKTKVKISLEDQLRDAWEGEGNRKRVTFLRWVRNMAANDRGTLQQAAKKFLLRRKRRKAKQRDPVQTLREGFWRSEREPTLPSPHGLDKPWKGKRKFLAALAKVEKRAHASHYKGSSNCRICDKRNGSATYEYDGWQWPSGYRHYVEVHNVRPSLAFQEFILGYYLGEP